MSSATWRQRIDEGMECWSDGVLGGSAYWEEWGFHATNRERTELCLFPVLHHSNTPTSFGFVPGVHVVITRAHSRSPKSLQELSPNGWRNDSGDRQYFLPGRGGGVREVLFSVGALRGCASPLCLSPAAVLAPPGGEKGGGRGGAAPAPPP